MKTKFFRWGIIFILLLSSPLIYTELQGYLTIHVAFPVTAFFSAKSFAALSTIFIGSGSVCAILTAAVVAVPCAYLARERIKIISTVMVALTQAIPVYSFFDQPKIDSFTSVVFAGQLTAYIISVALFAHVGLRIARRV